MATGKSGKTKAGASRSGGGRKRLTPSKDSRGLAAADIALPIDDERIAGLAAQVRDRGGAPIGAYREPLSGSTVLVAALPLSAVQPTPFQRDLSPTHTKRLAQKIDEAGSFLDPIIVVRDEKGEFCTPNGRHRLAAAKVLGLKQITALISPDEGLAFRILALNTEKAHNVKDRSLEVIRMARALARREPRAKEIDYSAQFEAPEFLTLGVLYAKDGRFAGGAYSSFLRKVDRFSDRTLAVSLREREGYAARLRDIDTQVRKIIKTLEARGFKSPYLRAFVVARINPVRFHRAKPGDKRPPMPIAAALTRMTAAARGFDVGKVRPADLALVAALSGD
ncbi:MAG TPA: ParB/RepB/Spo0J family partition protein [Steroidobacteraceae bacterium]|nr:ParB/RepB/Spo0J family partition protein [Steroidobacteraceae bacterium]